MDWQSIIAMARTQGAGFWLAAGAVSLGLTLLLAALAQGLRRALGAGGPGIRSRLARRPVILNAAGEDTYVAGPPPPPAAAATEAPAAAAPGLDPEHDSLAILLRRLQSAGDRLEQIAEDMTPDPLATGEDATRSTLKSELDDVEYVFRASGA